MAVENRYQKANRILKEIVAATLADDYVFTPSAVHEILIKKGFVLINPDLKNEAGEVATRATQAGIEAVPQEEKRMSEGSGGVSMANGFEIEDVPVVAGKRSGAGKKSIYPFDMLAMGQSFFVAATADKPEPWKSMSSTVGGASQKYAELVTNEDGSPKMRLVAKGPNKGVEVQETRLTRRFAITKAEKDGVPGARIGRVA